MDTRVMRNRLFGALADEFPEAKISHFAPIMFVISEEVEGRIAMIPVTMSENEAKLARSPDDLIKVYVASARQSFDDLLGNPKPTDSVILPTPQTT